MSRCKACGRPAYDPNNTSDREIADMALKKALEVLEYGHGLGVRYNSMAERIERLEETNRLLMQVINEIVP